MDKCNFARLFREAVRRALEQIGSPAASDDAVIEYYCGPNAPSHLNVDETVDALWLSPDRFYRLVDVAAFRGEAGPPVIFVRPAGFDPSDYENSWDPTGLGPFKVLGPMTRGRSG